jgi:carboxypeptidase C (cathepsin A)
MFRQVAAGLVAAALGAQASAPDTAGTGIVTSRGEVTADGKVLRYTARAGHIGIRDNEAGEVHGNMFFVAYTLDRAPTSRPRPLTFVWNGGPGSNSGLVHLLGFGPKRVTAATGSMPRFSPWGTALVDNQDTWLAHTDLVFVDPIGTGYSRPTKPEYASEFYQGRGDAESVAEFIRLYRTRFDAFDAPLFIAGESYGVTRASLVADALERRRTNLSGVILLSGGFPLSETPPVLRNALSLPTLTAAAFINRKLPSDLQSGDLLKALHAAESYAQTEYAAALARRDSLSSAEKDAVVAQLARFTGLAASQIDRNTLRVTTDQLSNLLMAPQVVGRYDSRLLGPRDTAARQYDPTTDPSLKDILDAVSVVRYMRNVLGFKSDLFYQGPFGGGYPPPTTFRGDWMSVKWNRGGPPADTTRGAAGAGRGGNANVTPNPGQALRSAMNTNPRLRVLVASGYFDLVSSYYEIEYAVKHLPPDLARRVTVHSYPGGHAAYTDDAVRHQFRQDAAAFVQAATSKQ